MKLLNAFPSATKVFQRWNQYMGKVSLIIIFATVWRIHSVNSVIIYQRSFFMLNVCVCTHWADGGKKRGHINRRFVAPTPFVRRFTDDNYIRRWCKNINIHENAGEEKTLQAKKRRIIFFSDFNFSAFGHAIIFRGAFSFCTFPAYLF